MLGRHDGILRYTIGQRRGIGIASGEPLYVVHLDADRARVIVGPREALETHKIYLRDVNWLGDGALADIPAEGIELFAKVRSTRPPRPAVLLTARRRRSGSSSATANPASRPARPACSTPTTATTPASRRRLHRALRARRRSRGHAVAAGGLPSACAARASNLSAG